MKSISSFCRQRTPLLLFLILSLFMTGFTSATAKEPSINDKLKAKNLFIIVADGLRYNDAFGNKNHLYTENIWTKLRPLGTICANFYNIELTYPIPAQASLLTGVWHIFENPTSITIRPAFPTLFEYWNKTRKESDVSSYFAANKIQFEILTSSEHKEYGNTFAPIFETNIKTCGDADSNKAVTEVTANAIYEKAVSYIFNSHPSFVYLNLDSGRGDEAYTHAHEECRITDKERGCEGEADQLNTYYESIILTDEVVYDFWNRVQRDEIYKDKSIFIFLSTHGRHTDDFHGYGDKCRGCQQLNFLIIGPGVKKDFISKKKRTLIDICPTVGALCDIPTPYAKGKIMKEILE